MQAGQLRHRITLQSPVNSRTSGAGTSRAWTDVCIDIPAAIEPLSGGEQFAAAQVQSSVTAKITIRWRRGVNATLRIVHVLQVGSPDEVEIFNIESVVVDATGKRWIEMMCKHRDADGFQSDG